MSVSKSAKEMEMEAKACGGRVRELFGWHFPELSILLPNDRMYCRVVLALNGSRAHATEPALGSLSLKSDLVHDIIDASHVSMGIDMDERDTATILQLAQNTLDLFSHLDTCETTMEQ